MCLNHLDFNGRTRKRAEWEAFEFEIAGPYQVRVRNASYGEAMHEHAYVVGIEDRDGVLVPAECECPADLHHDRDCKHKVALAIRGGSLLMQAAADYEPPEAPVPRETLPTLADKLRSDGGAISDSAFPPTAADESCWCEAHDMPCFDCYQSGRRTLPE
jgi:hypothetical protein